MKEQIEKMAQEICAFCVETCGDCNLISGKPCESVMEEAEALYNAGYRKQREGEWIVTERQCIITCSECGHRLELCYPDGTEVRSLPACPICGRKMRK